MNGTWLRKRSGEIREAATTLVALVMARSASEAKSQKRKIKILPLLQRSSRRAKVLALALVTRRVLPLGLPSGKKRKL